MDAFDSTLYFIVTLALSMFSLGFISILLMVVTTFYSARKHGIARSKLTKRIDLEQNEREANKIAFRIFLVYSTCWAICVAVAMYFFVTYSAEITATLGVSKLAIYSAGSALGFLFLISILGIDQH